MSTASDTHAKRRLMAEAALAAAGPDRRDWVCARHGLAALPHASGAGREPGVAALLHRRQYAAEPARLRRALCRRRRAVAAGWGCSHPCRRLPLRLVHWRHRLDHRRHHRRHHRVSHCQERFRRGVWPPAQDPFFPAFARDFSKTPSAICYSCGSCRSFRFGSSIWRLDCLV